MVNPHPTQLCRTVAAGCLRLPQCQMYLCQVSPIPYPSCRAQDLRQIGPALLLTGPVGWIRDLPTSAPGGSLAAAHALTAALLSPCCLPVPFGAPWSSLAVGTEDTMLGPLCGLPTSWSWWPPKPSVVLRVSMKRVTLSFFLSPCKRVPRLPQDGDR